MSEAAVTGATAARAPLTLEEKKAAARARAKAARAAEAAGVRLRILAGGCSGLEYKLDLLDRGEAAGAGERAIESNGVTMPI